MGIEVIAYRVGGKPFTGYLSYRPLPRVEDSISPSRYCHKGLRNAGMESYVNV